MTEPLRRATSLSARGCRNVAALFAYALAIGITGCSTATTPNTSEPTQQPVETQHVARHRRHRHRDSNGSNAANATVTTGATPQAQADGNAFPCNDRQFLTDRQAFANGQLSGDQLVDVCGSVTRVLPERDSRSGEHGYYYIQVASGVTVEVVCNLDEMNAPAWPWVAAGNYSYVQGRYYYDSASSQGIDWTHHGSSRAWPTPGYVVVDGKMYN